jgi:hypothetical protein
MEQIRCEYVYTVAEYQQSLKCFRQCSPRKWLIRAWMVFVVVFLGCFAAYQDKDESPAAKVGAALFAILAGAVMWALAFAYSLFASRRAFQKGLACNQKIEFTLDEEGYEASTPLTRAQVKWTAFTTGCESERGFIGILMGNRSFIWWPKHGLEQDEIPRLRVLLKEKIPKFKAFP